MEIAIIGLACKLPGADNYTEFWENLIGKKSSVTEIPANRWNWKEYWGNPKTERNKSFSKWGAFVNDVDAFDFEFFGVLPKVVQTMDPQQRIMMELAWACLEDAGIPPSSLSGEKVGVIFGIFNHDYKELQESGNLSIEAHHSTGTAATVIANRVSHFFNLRGPSIPIDTACSSSFNALHSAIQAIKFGDCEMALAGGINLLLTPTRHISFSKMGMLSPTGSCKSFDDNADGYVRGEGAGIVLLKPLEKALEDGDSIHAVIKGSAVNHSGETHSLTYPSPRAQADAIVAAHEMAQIPVTSIGYVEAHGTGTPKGDPIEFEGLLKAFSTLSKAQGVDIGKLRVGVGSAKTNIGHLEAAAGIAGLIKVLLSMKNKQLPALQNFTKLNSRISAVNTPFYFLDKSREWDTIECGQTLNSNPNGKKYYPLRAGVSSFGFGGTNSHIILEEAPEPRNLSKKSNSTKRPSYLIALSAKTKEALSLKKRDLLLWLKKDGGRTPLYDISATLLLCRDHFEIREAYVSQSTEELLDQLEKSSSLEADALEGRNPHKEPGQPQAELGQEILDQLSTKKRIAAAKYNDHVNTLAKIYGSGTDISWEMLFANKHFRKVNLPTYPFAKHRFWIPEEDDTAVGVGDARKLHPLLHENISNLEIQSYTTTFNGKEFFLKDHNVKGNPVLPAAAYLEMARVAVVNAFGLANAADKFIHLKDIFWLRPLTVYNNPEIVHINVYPKEESTSFRSNLSLKTVSFEITHKNSQSEDSLILCQGDALVSDAENYSSVDIAELKKKAGGKIYSNEHCYQIFDAIGLKYGPTHQAISQISGDSNQYFSDLLLPKETSYNSGQFFMHPSMVDASLQTAVGLVGGLDLNITELMKNPKPPSPYVPFVLEELTVINPSTQKMLAWVRYSPDKPSVGDANNKLDIDIFDISEGPEKAKLCQKLRGLRLRKNTQETIALSKPPDTAMPIQPPQDTKNYYTPIWVDEPLKAQNSENIDNILILGETEMVSKFAASLKATDRFKSTTFVYIDFDKDFEKVDSNHYKVCPQSLGDYERVISNLVDDNRKVEYLLLLSPQGINIGSDQCSVMLEDSLLTGAEGLFALCKVLIKKSKMARFIHMVEGIEDEFNPLWQGLSGFYKTLKIEKPTFNGRVIQFDRGKVSDEELAEIIHSEFLENDKECDIVYKGRKRFIRTFNQLSDINQDVLQQQCPSNGASASFRKNGVYLITGGMGALGLIVAKYLSRKYEATLYLTGRSPVDEKITKILSEISALGGKASYIICNVADYKTVQDAVQTICDEGHSINGVMHCAGVIEDSFILRKSQESFAKVIRPKVVGTLNLDWATKTQPLDCFVLFSSVTGVLGNLGQCDYGYGNSFEDYFSHYRNILQKSGIRHGKASSINWPYWKDGGMRLTDKEEEILYRNFGIIPLENDRGLKALEYSLASPLTQLVVMEGDTTKIHQVLGVRVDSVNRFSSESETQDTQPLKQTIARYLIDLFSKELNISADRFDLDSSFQKYGFDSVVMLELVNVLERKFAGLPKTLFFENQSLRELADYFLENYADHFSNIQSSGSNNVSNTEVNGKRKVATTRARFMSEAPQQKFSLSPEAHLDVEDEIVIVGLSGRYPEAENIEIYWENLKEGRDCVREIPADRWDLEKSFQPGPSALGKSYSKWGGFLKDVDKFDPLFFNISPKEAEHMDPQERLFLETVALTIEDAGYTPDKIASSDGVRDNPVGVYVGVMWGDYQLFGVESDDPSAWRTPHSYYWAVANRVSYYFNFSGPSLAVDTACSSSLTAIHLACNAIRSGEIKAAIAGGVNLSLHPNKYNLLSDMQFLSTDGRCRSFGVGGDGYVPGEGVGAVLLKPLSVALRDGDHIYGVIKGSSLNHGGKTTGFTVPNPKRQAALIREAMEKAAVDPRNISYLEAHGTGTSLGDPIEISGLSKAFAQQEHQYCAIGSAKSNIGHLEAAAGVAGLTKVLLQLKYQKLVPSLHSEVINPNIDLENSPFYVQRHLQDWTRPILEDNRGGSQESLRLAGISSFGAGGANGHLLIEEYAKERIQESKPNRSPDEPLAFVLSAKNNDSLQAMVKNLAAFIQRTPEVSFEDMIYTLQIGRVQMDYRFAVVAKNAPELLSKLNAYLQGDTDIMGVYTGRKTYKVENNVLADDTQLGQSINRWMQNRNYDKLAATWVNGTTIEWERLYGQNERKRISLPGYVFNRQRYWIEKPKGNSISMLHPLIDSNVSTIHEQVFEKTFNPEAFYLKDHRIGDARVLPGVAYLEMAVQAGKRTNDTARVTALNNVVWSKPIIVNEKDNVTRIGLVIDEYGIINYEIYQQEGEQKTVFSEGSIEYTESHELTAGSTEKDLNEFSPETVDIDAIKVRCALQDRAAIIAGFEVMGFNFGPTFQVFDLLYYNDQEALGKLTLPKELTGEFGSYILHPALLDGMLRTSLGIGGISASSHGMPLPISLDRIELVRPLETSCFAYATYSANRPEHPLQQSFDIRLLNHDGKMLVCIEGLTTQIVSSIGVNSQPSRDKTAGKSMSQDVASKPVAVIQDDANRGRQSSSALIENESSHYEVVKNYLAELIAEVTKLPVNQIDPHAPLENYGIDSVMILAINQKLENVFGSDVSKTLFFEYLELHSLAEYFVENHLQDIEQHLFARNKSNSGQAQVRNTEKGTNNNSEHTQTTPVNSGENKNAVSGDQELLETEQLIAQFEMYLLNLMHEVLGSRTTNCATDTPIYEWKLDPIDNIKLVHRLQSELRDVQSDLFYRGNDIKTIAAELVDSHRSAIDWLMQKGAIETSVTTKPRRLPNQSRIGRRFSGLSVGKGAYAEHEEIAIIGLSGRYPAAETLQAFWENLASGKDCITEIPTSRWDHGLYFDKDRNKKGHVYSKWGGFLENIDQFDAGFFNISRREAEILDPQERIFLQTVWQCIEDAAYTRQSLNTLDVGVFVGVMWGHYELIQVSEEQMKYGKPTASFASIANRVSYFFNFHGPSVALDTMCSSSITAIHTACQSIRNGDCHIAIAGGVNLSTHITKYQLLSQEQFLSTDGRCRAFGDGGDGYVPGEGAGAVLLKPLSHAIRDGDHIYGIVKATAVNHGGKSNGYRVPNQKAQSNVISKAISLAGWTPESIGYIEAHGTGTSLGDPIEVTGLSQAFKVAEEKRQSSTQTKRQFCRLGSIKSNIGHLESAAGIAGLTKVLLQMKHKKIVPSLHSETINSNIKFENTPFRVVQRLEDWEPPLAREAGVMSARKGTRLPRRAGISSFGAGGSNAHLLVEEFQALVAPIDNQFSQNSGDSPVIFVLSADTEQRLNLYVDSILSFLKNSEKSIDIKNLAFTSQIGREVMNERLASIVSSVEELVGTLTQYREGELNGNFFRGGVGNHTERLDSFLDDEAKDSLIQSMLKKKELKKLAKAWVNTLDVDWAKYTPLLFPSSQKTINNQLLRPKRISFPTMPFVTQRYWIQEAPPVRSTNSFTTIHPFVDYNISTLTDQRYVKEFQGNEFYLRDHIIHSGNKKVILPGVAYLEMAHTTGEHAVGNAFRVQKIKNVMWLKPIEVKNKPLKIYINLFQKDTSVDYEVVSYSPSTDKSNNSDDFDDNNKIIHSHGEIFYEQKDSVAKDEWIDLKAIQAQAIAVDEKPDIYRDYRRMGFHYGPSYQITQVRHRLPNSALSELKLPDHLQESFSKFALHPSLLDAAVRSCLGIGDPAKTEHSGPIVPFALDEIEIRHPLVQSCFVLAVPAERADDDLQTALRKYNLVVADSTGKVLVKIAGFAGKLMSKPENHRDETIHYFDYEWIEAPLKDSSIPLTTSNQDVLMVLDREPSLVNSIRKNYGSDKRVVYVKAGTEFNEIDNVNYVVNPSQPQDYTKLMLRLTEQGIKIDRVVHRINGANEPVPMALVSDLEAKQRLNTNIDHGIYSILFLFQALENTQKGHKTRCIYVFNSGKDTIQPEHEAISGFAKSLLGINHRFELVTLQYGGNTTEEQLAGILVNELSSDENPTGDEIRYVGTKRFQRLLRDYKQERPFESSSLPLKEKGVYLITGGLGKLGMVFAKYLAMQYKARLVLTGRSPLNDRQREAIQELENYGAEVCFVKADISDPNSVKSLISDAENRFTEINGVIHGAGVVDATQITDLDKSGFYRVLAPKLDGLIELDNATQCQPIDFFVTFSSISALLGDLGSGSYAVANRFMDSYVLLRDQRRKQGQRNGVSISINWPLWAAGGMEIPEEEIAFFNYSGIQPLKESEGIKAFEHILSSGLKQVVVATGDKGKMKRVFKINKNEEISEEVKDIRTPTLTEQTAYSQSSIKSSIEFVSRAGENDGQVNEESLQVKVEEYLKSVLAPIIKTTATDINAGESFESHGLDSVMLMEMHTSLNKDIEGLPKTALFEYDTISRLAQYLVRNNRQTIQTLLKTAESPPNELTNKATENMEVEEHRNITPVASAIQLPTSNKKRYNLPSTHRTNNDDIAIIGVAGRFPKAEDLLEFWKNVRNAKDCVEVIPRDRWDADQYYFSGERRSSNQTRSKWGGFLKDVDKFDCDFFRISQAEAEKMDPQLRLMLMTAWQSLEDAAYTPVALAPFNVGVYVGVMNEDFTWVASEIYNRTAEYVGPGSMASELANRISFALNLRGPSLVVNTACSSSLTAVHLAKSAILAGECDMALAGGVNLSIHHSKYLLLDEMKVLSPDGEERTFDDSANGLVPCEGAGIVVLKRYSKALEDGDQIYGVIKGSAISHSGVGAGQYLPNIKVMEETVTKCIEDSGINIDDLNYIECHGTGTELGDPIEMKALANAIRKYSDKEQFCALGSKANFGHMEAASGICSLIKVLLNMKYKYLSPCAKLSKVNSSFDLNASPFFLPGEAIHWPANDRFTRVAGINSFGLGGSNAFMLIESVNTQLAGTKDITETKTPNDSIVLFSAKSRSQVESYVDSMVRFLTDEDNKAYTEVDFSDIAYSTQVGRMTFEHRLAIVAKDIDDFLEKANNYLNHSSSRIVEGVFAGDTVNSNEIFNLLGGQEGKDFVNSLIVSKQWSKIASIWSKGNDIDWELVHQGYKRKRVSLPTYPFENHNIHIDNYLKRNGINKKRKESRPSAKKATSPVEQGETGIKPETVKGKWYRIDPETIDFNTLIYGVSESTGQIAANNEEVWLKNYWVDYLGDVSQQGQFWGSKQVNSNQTEHNSAKGPNEDTIGVLSYSLSEELTHVLQAYTQSSKIELDTLIVAAWAILISRYTKLNCAQFGLCKIQNKMFADNESGKYSPDYAANVLPLKIKTVVKWSISNWLDELQGKMNRKSAVAGRISLKQIEQWLEVEGLFDSVLVFHDGNKDSDNIKNLGRCGVPLELWVEPSSETVKLKMVFQTTYFNEEKIEQMLEHVHVLLEGMMANPERNPATLSMQTNREYREKFWQSLEKVQE